MGSLMAPCYDRGARAGTAEPEIHLPTGHLAYGDVMRLCTRNGCRDHARVSLTFQYASSVIWLDHLADERQPGVYELCDTHWRRFVSPNGWQIDDRRRVDVLPFVHRLAG